jgi:hypothetical protein
MTLLPVTLLRKHSERQNCKLINVTIDAIKFKTMGKI